MPYVIPKNYIPFVLMFAVGLSVASIDLYIPSLPYMQNYFQTSSGWMQFSLSVSIVGSSVVTLFLGQLADRWGRRIILVGFQFLFSLTCMGIAFSQNVETFIILRFIAGIFSTGAYTISYVVVGDIFEEKIASQYYAYLTSSILFALILAPIVGGIFASINHWEYSFMLLSILTGLSAFSLWMFVPETLAQQKPFILKDIWVRNRKIIFQSKFYNYVIVSSVLLGAMISFFSSASFYYIQKIGLSPGIYTLHQVSIAAFHLGFSFLTPFFFRRYGLNSSLRSSIFLAIGGSVLFAMFSILYSGNPLLLSMAASIFVGSVSLCISATTALVLKEFSDERATASSLIVLLRGLLMALTIIIGGLLYKGSAMDIASTFVLFSAVSFGFYLRQRRAENAA